MTLMYIFLSGAWVPAWAPMRTPCRYIFFLFFSGCGALRVSESKCSCAPLINYFVALLRYKFPIGQPHNHCWLLAVGCRIVRCWYIYVRTICYYNVPGIIITVILLIIRTRYYNNNGAVMM